MAGRLTLHAVPQMIHSICLRKNLKCLEHGNVWSCAMAVQIKGIHRHA